MAVPPDTSQAQNPLGRAISTNSYETALCIIPPRHLWPAVDRLRVLYDKAYGKWPPHLNLVYPFVQAGSLDMAAEAIGAVLAGGERSQGGAAPSRSLRLHEADVFPHRRGNTIFLCDGDESRTEAMEAVRARVLAALGLERRAPGEHGSRLHMSVAQSDDLSGSSHRFLVRKAGLLPALEWEVDRLHVLVRERPEVDGLASSVMKEWAVIDMHTGVVSKRERPVDFYDIPSTLHRASEGEGTPVVADEADEADESDSLFRRPAYYYDEDARWWEPIDRSTQPGSSPQSSVVASCKEFTVSSYNVLAESAQPPTEMRYPLVVRSILSELAAADMLVLQEVTDDFLAHLLQRPEIRKAYPFASHGPPDQADIEPLPSFLNMVVLSRHAFDWDLLPFARRHKGAVVVRLRGCTVGKWEDGEFMPLVVATVHLTHGLSDGAVAAKLGELQRVLRFLDDRAAGHPQVLLGDFNMATSRYTIDAALKNGDITAHTADSLAGMEDILARSGFVDAWEQLMGSHPKPHDGEREEEEAEFEGEQGATFDPTTNALARAAVGSGANNRPQRYDRILVRGADVFGASGFNHFARAADGEDGLFGCASDHWGVRCVLARLLTHESGERDDNTLDQAQVEREELGETIAPEIVSRVIQVELKRAVPGLRDVQSLTDALSHLGAFPTDDEIKSRETALETLKSILLDAGSSGDGRERQLQEQQARSKLVFVPVGSYGLGVWTSTSDLDLLCIGPYSSTTFFALATQRIRKAAAAKARKGPPGAAEDSTSAAGAAAAADVRLLRRVRASTGTMLELEVAGVRIDLQYCAATAIAEQWPAALALPASDPAFALPAQTLGKLKAARDMDTILRTVPNLDQFQLAHRAVKTWARARGIYSARFGYLCGVSISMLLARVCKLLLLPSPLSATPPASLSVTDILTTFFAHYASFDWRNQVAFDPFFHSTRLQYLRSAREPLAILGYFPPVLNTSHAASLPSMCTIADQFRLADALLSREARGEAAVSWSEFLAGGAADAFLRAYKSYIRIDLQYWGISLSRGAQFVGWLESRCPAVLVDLSFRVPGVHARMWPARFVDAVAAAATARATAEALEDRDYRGCYLIGLEHREERGREDQRAAAGALQTVLRRFEDLIRGDERYFDGRSQWMSASVVRRSELGELAQDSREWGEFTAGDDDEEEEDESEDEEDGRDEDDSLNEGEDKASSKARRAKKVSRNGKKTKKGGAGAGNAATVSGAKFRTAADAMNRLRWDPSLDSGDFIVGYEDRFKGAQEKALNAWKSELTDEEFIPQHRILYFKRRSDGVVVWERRTRKDELFGSG